MSSILLMIEAPIWVLNGVLAVWITRRRRRLRALKLLLEQSQSSLDLLSLQMPLQQESGPQVRTTHPMVDTTRIAPGGFSLASPSWNFTDKLLALQDGKDETVNKIVDHLLRAAGVEEEVVMKMTPSIKSGMIISLNDKLLHRPDLARAWYIRALELTM